MLMQRELGCLEIPMLDGKVVWDADLEGRLVSPDMRTLCLF